MRIKVSVTKGDIKKIYDWNKGNCPISLAVHRTVKDLTGAEVYVSTAYKIIGREILTGKLAQPTVFEAELPRSAKRFINAFDANKKVKPFNFFLNV